MAQLVKKKKKKSACNPGDQGTIPGLGISPVNPVVLCGKSWDRGAGAG